MARTPEKTRNARLRRIRDALRVAVPQLQELELWRDVRGTPHLRGKYEHWRPQGAWQTEDQFSDGTLRLLGLLWATLEGSGPLLLEEPEMSLHPEVVRFVPQMFARIQRRSGRQILLSTHSTDLLRDDGIGLDEVLLLQPATEGTVFDPQRISQRFKVLLDGGATLADAVIPADPSTQCGDRCCRDVIVATHARIFSGAVEGVIDEAVLRRLVEHAGGVLDAVYGKAGKPNCESRSPATTTPRASRHGLCWSISTAMPTACRHLCWIGSPPWRP